MSESKKLVGSRVKRSEDPRLLTGNGSYVDDKQIPGLLHIALRRSDTPHARILHIDTDQAKGLPGVIAVYTAEDLDAVVKPIHAISKMANYHSTAILPLAKGKVRFVGEAVVAVVAVNRYVAEDAIELIQIDYEPLDNIVNPYAAAESNSALLHEEIGTNILIQREFRRGEIDEVMQSAPIKVGARFRMHRKTPLSIENRSYLGQLEKGKQLLTLYSSTGSPGIVRDALVQILGMPGNRIRVIAPDVGGSFGGKGSLYPEEILVAAIAKHLQKPVKWTSDRLEDLSTTSQAFDETIDAELAVDHDGTILGLRADVVGDVGAYSIYPWTAGLETVQVISFMPGPYRVPVYLGKVRGVATCKAPTGPYRGVGRPTSTFVMERLMDMAAHQLKMDPRDIRLRNLIKNEEFPYKTAPGIVWDRANFIEALKLGCETIGYDSLRAKRDAMRAEGKWMGIGISSYAELSGIGSRISASPGMPINTGTEIATLKIDPSGSITASFGIASHGQGLETTLAQIVADELGCRMQDITVVHGDTDAVSHSTGTYASRSAVLAGGAGTRAAQALRTKLIKLAAYMLGSHPEYIQISEGNITATDNGKYTTIAEVADTVYSQMGRIPPDVVEVLEETQSYDPVWGTTSSATHIAVVEIDPETFMVHVKDYLVSEDCGKMINPLIVDGQVHGGVAQGIGAALYEEVVYDDQGQILSASLVDYIVPTAPEMPNMTVLHVESILPNTIGGFRGMGEGGTIGAPAAIANAISDALMPMGIEITELPATPERLFQLIKHIK